MALFADFGVQCVVWLFWSAWCQETEPGAGSGHKYFRLLFCMRRGTAPSVSSVCMRHVHVRTSYNWQKRGTDNIESYEYDKLQGIQA